MKNKFIKLAATIRKKTNIVDDYGQLTEININYIIGTM